MRLNPAIAAALGAALTLSLLPAGAAASRSQETIFEDGTQLIARGIQVQEQTLQELRSLGVDKVRVNVSWRSLVPGDPNSRRRPPGNPASVGWYRAGRFAIYDNLVREANRRGIDVLLTPAGASRGGKLTRVGLPRWARNRDGSPSIGEFESFVAALGRRYNGSGRGHGGSLPKVRNWSIWNEPNQGGWLLPQWRKSAGNYIPASPHTYRALYLAGRRALLRVGHRRSRVFIGETAGLGRDRVRTRRSAMAPGRFYRELACLDANLRPFRGSAAAARPGCTSFRKLRTNGVNHHFYTRGATAPALFRPRDPDQFPAAGVPRLERLLDRLAARRRITGHLGIWNTEFGFQTNPPDPTSNTSLEGQAREQNIAEYLGYRRPRIRSFAHYLMRDDPCKGRNCLGYQTGLKGNGGELKPAYDGFAMPIFVRETDSSRRVTIWGAARAGGRGTDVFIHANGIRVGRVRITNPRGYFEVPVTVARGFDARKLEWQITDPVRNLQSRIARSQKL